ncbi:MAG: AAA family ATPase [Solirubrobacteraceae bacterium]
MAFTDRGDARRGVAGLVDRRGPRRRRAGLARGGQSADGVLLTDGPSGAGRLGAQAAERLAAELSEAGVTAEGYSTAALRAAVAGGVVTFSPEVTVVLDEAALASTREQAWLLGVAVGSGVRVIEVGDPRQSGAVGAGGLWPRIEQAASDHGGLAELPRIVRAKDAGDRRDQARWRAGEHERALTGYAARGRVVVEAFQRQAEDRAPRGRALRPPGRAQRAGRHPDLKRSS